MKTIMPVILLLALAISAIAQSYDTPKFRENLKAIAGTVEIDRSDYNAVGRIATGFERKAYVKSLSPSRQLNVWRLHFAYALTFLSLTPEQESLIREGFRFLTLDMFRTDKKLWIGSEEQRAYQDYTERVVQAFGSDPALYRNVFEIPGPTTVEVVSLCQLKTLKNVSYKGRYVSASLVLASFKPLPPDCDCNWSIGCSAGSCQEISCRPVINCGIFGWNECGFKCQA